MELGKIVFHIRGEDRQTASLQYDLVCVSPVDKVSEIVFHIEASCTRMVSPFPQQRILGLELCRSYPQLVPPQPIISNLLHSPISFRQSQYTNPTHQRMSQQSVPSERTQSPRLCFSSLWKSSSFNTNQSAPPPPPLSERHQPQSRPHDRPSPPHTIHSPERERERGFLVWLEGRREKTSLTAASLCRARRRIGAAGG